MKRIYLAHSGAERERGQEIQASLEKLGIYVDNPFDKENEQKASARWEDGKAIWDMEPDEELESWIVAKDEVSVRKADAIIMIYPEHSTPTIGTPCEMTFAKMIGVPIYAWVGEWMSSHPFVNTYCDYVFHDMTNLYQKVGQDLGNTKGCYELIHDLLRNKYSMPSAQIYDLIRFMEQELRIKIC